MGREHVHVQVEEGAWRHGSTLTRQAPTPEAEPRSDPADVLTTQGDRER